MKLDQKALRRRRRARAIVFVGSALAVLALRADGGRSIAPLGLLPLLGLYHCWPGAQAVTRLRRPLASRSVLSAALIGALAFVVTAAISLLMAMPQPIFHDEFSYLLAADTFAHGRLANPTHPMWVHFEAPHIFHQPTYASAYPPGQGMILALGQVVFGQPIAGVWLSAGLACGALTWMLAGWMPGRWALAGGLLAAAHPATIFWSQNYWGGLVATFGGALMLGAFRRIVRRPRARHAVVLGLGLAILANSRPYEGLVLSVPFAVALAIWLVTRQPDSAGATFRRVALPLAVVLAVTASWMLYYNYRVTGDPLTPGHLHAQRTYGTEPIFLFQDPGPLPTYRHEHLRRLFAEEVSRQPERTIAGLAERVRSRTETHASWYFRSWFVVFAVAILWPLERNRWYLAAIVSLGVFVAVGLGLPSWSFSHYSAPAAGLLLLVFLRAMRRIGIWRLGRHRFGQPLVQALWILVVAILALESWDSVRFRRETRWPYERVRISADLNTRGEKHLVVVRYSPAHDPHEEWVHNAADIDAASVVWAQDMGSRENAPLLDYFKDRHVWLLEPDSPQVKPIPYPARQVR